MSWNIIQGNALSVLQSIPDQEFQTCITSPPYWNLRDYEVDDQLGHESTPQQYIKSLVEIFREVKRTLRDDGILWLNIGDSYCNRSVENIKPKDLIGIPWMLAFALRTDGWYLRSDIIWAKPNPMPESVRDRLTRSHENIFLITKNKKYFYDADAIREPFQMKPQRRPKGRPKDSIPRLKSIKTKLVYNG